MQPQIARDFHPHLLPEACALFGVSLSSAPILLAENSNLVFDCGSAIVRFSHSSQRSFLHIEQELTWTKQLHERGLPVVEVYASKNGRLVEQLDCGDTSFSVACFEKLTGERMDFRICPTEKVEALGELVGRMHQASASAPAKQMSFPCWDTILEARDLGYVPDDERGLRVLAKQVLSTMQTLPVSEETCGLVHYDIHHGNYLITPTRGMVLFDFEMACHAWYALDVASCFYYALNSLQKRFSSEDEAIGWFAPHFWRGYERFHYIAEEEKKLFPIFLLYRDLLVYGYVCRVWEGKAYTDDNLRYLARMERNIERRRLLVGMSEGG
jgi:Ser/Thr protein kinase RdoA (MazF antagonist)